MVMKNEGRNRQDRMREAYTAELEKVPRLSTTLMEDCSLDIDSKARKRRRKERDIRIRFL